MIFNFNVGVLGHVDSGKTSLVKALSTTASTACFDKNPQSRERGITLDLGFSSFEVELPDHIKSAANGGGSVPPVSGNLHSDALTRMQVTLVDCPGHASLIRTIIGGSQIIDLMLLVVDVVKGVQTQTAECLVIGEILCKRMIVVLNKIDLLPDDTRASSIDKMSKRLAKTLEKTRFASSPIVAVSANPGAGTEVDSTRSIGISELIQEIRARSYIPVRNVTGGTVFSVDHCFAIRGQGAVMTGTILQGEIRTNDVLEIPHLKVTKKVKSMQMFRKPVDIAQQGDRVGICVTQFDPSLFERGFVCSPGALHTIHAAIITVHKISYYKLPVISRSKFHITVGHDTVMATMSLFLDDQPCSSESLSFDLKRDYIYWEQVRPEDLTQGRQAFALLEFERPIICSQNALLIGSKLDLDVNTSSCRIAFYGNVVLPIADPMYREMVLPSLKVYKTKTKEGVVERVADDYTIVGRNMFKKETNIQAFVGMNVTLTSGEKGVIEGSFGQSGKYKIRLREPLSDQAKKKLSGAGAKKKGKSEVIEEASEDQIKITLAFKRYIYDSRKSMKQS